MYRTGNKEVDAINREYLETVIRHHVSGRFKVAPEHTSDKVLHLMRKPSFKLFRELTARFNTINNREHLRQQIIPYFISSHPGCSLGHKYQRIGFQAGTSTGFYSHPHDISHGYVLFRFPSLLPA